MRLRHSLTVPQFFPRLTLVSRLLKVVTGSEHPHAAPRPEKNFLFDRANRRRSSQRRLGSATRLPRTLPRIRVTQPVRLVVVANTVWEPLTQLPVCLPLAL